MSSVFDSISFPWQPELNHYIQYHFVQLPLLQLLYWIWRGLFWLHSDGNGANDMMALTVMAWLYMTCPGLGNTHFLYLAHHESQTSGDNFTLTDLYTLLQY